MALLFMDSFDHYQSADITEKWTERLGTGGSYDPYAIIGAYGRNSTQGMRVGNNGIVSSNTFIPGFTRTVAPANNVLIVGAAVRISSFAGQSKRNNSNEETSNYGGGQYVFAFRNVNSRLCFVRVNGDGTLSVLRYGVSTDDATVLGTTSGSLQVNVWAYVEVKITVHNSAGTVDVRINGVNSLSLTGVNTRGNGTADAWTQVRCASYCIPGSGPVPTVDFDDFVIMDGSGSYNNAFIGDVTITALKPSGVGTTAGWTPSAGSNYDCVNEDLINDDTDYISSSTASTKDTYAMPDAPVGADIRAVQIVIGARKGTDGPGKIKPVIRSNSVDYDGTELGLGGTAYAFYRAIYETDPGSGSPLQPWTESGWNAVEVGVKKTG